MFYADFFFSRTEKKERKKSGAPNVMEVNWEFHPHRAEQNFASTRRKGGKRTQNKVYRNGFGFRSLVLFLFFNNGKIKCRLDRKQVSRGNEEVAEVILTLPDVCCWNAAISLLWDSEKKIFYYILCTQTLSCLNWPAVEIFKSDRRFIHDLPWIQHTSRNLVNKTDFDRLHL